MCTTARVPSCTCLSMGNSKGDCQTMTRNLSRYVCSPTPHLVCECLSRVDLIQDQGQPHLCCQLHLGHKRPLLCIPVPCRHARWPSTAAIFRVCCDENGVPCNVRMSGEGDTHTQMHTAGHVHNRQEQIMSLWPVETSTTCARPCTGHARAHVHSCIRGRRS